MSFCLPQGLANLFKEKLKSGEVDPQKLSDMTSAERNKFFSDFLGESNAKSVNALFESKLLLKNQQTGIINWAKSITGLKPEILKDMLSKVSRLNEVLQPKELDRFLGDLASQRLGVDVTQAEAAKILELSKKVQETKANIPSDAKNGSAESIEYGLALTEFKKYVGELKLSNKDTSLRYYAKHQFEALSTLGGMAKSAFSTLDNSYFGRQGIKTFYINPKIWADGFLKSWGDIGKELKGTNAMDLIHADAWSRENARNGMYGKMKLDIGLSGEEAFPEHIFNKIPGVKRVVSAAEAAFNGGAIRQRVDLADRLIQLAKDQGVDVTSKDWAEQAGKQINSVTGRGSLNKYFTPEGQKAWNNVVFSGKFLKSQFDVLLDPFNRNLDPFVRKQAALNLTKILAGVAAINVLSSVFQKNGSEPDPRATNFARPRVPLTNAHVDISGGLTSLMTLASRTIIPTKHDGQWGLWSKSSTGNWTNLIAGKYGQQTGWDTLIDGLFSNKLSPLFGLARDVLRGQNFSGNKVTPISALQSLIVPGPIQIGNQLKNSQDGANYLWLMLLEELGFGVSSNKKLEPKKSTFKAH